MPTSVPYSCPPTLEIVRGAVPAGTVAGICAEVRRVLGERDRLPDGQAEILWSLDLARMMRLGALKHPAHILGFLKDTVLPAFCRDVLGPDIACCLAGTFVRDFRPDLGSEPARMHFDANVLGLSVPMLNVWVPLNDVGRDAPGLTMATRPHWPRAHWDKVVAAADRNGLFPTGARAGLAFPYEEIVALAHEEAEWPLVDPELVAGDVLVFDHQHIHGTQMSLATAGRRSSLEIRLVSVESARRLKALGGPQEFVIIR